MSSTGHHDSSSFKSVGSDGKSSGDSLRSLTECGAVLNLLKFNIGLGIISLPEATKHVGSLYSLLGLGLLAFVIVWGIFFSVQSRLKLDKLEEESRHASDARALSEGDPLIHRRSWQDLPDSGCGFFDKIVGKVFGPTAQGIFTLSIALGQFTTLIIYLIVIVESFNVYFPEHHAEVLVGVVAVLGAFCLIPTLQGIAVLSALGLSIYAFLFVGLLLEFVHKVNTGTLPPSAVMTKTLDDSAGQWFGISCFAFSSFPIAIVIYDEMINPRAFYNVIMLVFVICWSVYSAFALLGYYCYGDDTNILIYFNFEAGSTFRNGSAGAVACMLCFSFVLQAMPVFSCTARALEHSSLAATLGVKGAPGPVIRWSVLAATTVVAYLVPNVKVIMTTVGAISGVTGGFIFPAFTYLVLSSRDEWMERARCILVVVVGVVGAYYSCLSAYKH